LEGLEARGQDDEVVFCFALAFDLDAFFGEAGDFAGFKGDVGLGEGGEVVIGYDDAFAADGVFGGQFVPTVDMISRLNDNRVGR